MTPDRLKKPFEYQFINPAEHRDTLKNNPTWYVNTPFAQLINTFILGQDTGEPHWHDTRMEIVRFMAEALQNNGVFLGNWPEFKNDDDRWHEHMRQMFPRENDIRKSQPDMVIVHHTAMPLETTLQDINALQLLRLYVRPFREVFIENGSHQPISSGHFTDTPLWEGHDITQPIFIGYHWAVDNNGNAVQILKDEYTGFQAGDYLTNCRSTGVVILDNLQDKHPTENALSQVAAITKRYNPLYVIGHGQVMVKTKTGEIKAVDTQCPGASFYGANGWMNNLVQLIDLPNIRTHHPLDDEES